MLAGAVMRFGREDISECYSAFGSWSNPETFSGVNARPDFSGAQVVCFFVTHLLWFDFRPVLKYFKLFFQLISSTATLPFVCNSFWVNLFWKQITQNKSLTLLRTVVVSRNEEKTHRQRVEKLALEKWLLTTKGGVHSELFNRRDSILGAGTERANAADRWFYPGEMQRNTQRRWLRRLVRHSD